MVSYFSTQSAQGLPMELAGTPFSLKSIESSFNGTCEKTELYEPREPLQLVFKYLLLQFQETSSWECNLIYLTIQKDLLSLKKVLLNVPTDTWSFLFAYLIKKDKVLRKVWECRRKRQIDNSKPPKCPKIKLIWGEVQDRFSICFPMEF